MPTRPRQHGFTIVELLVTMSILGLMLFLVNQLFNDTSRAVTISVQTSKTIAQSRSINEQITQDADAMVGPGDPLNGNPGFIVIIQERLPAVSMLDPRTLAELPSQVQLRSDQLIFIRDAEGLKSMTPSREDSYISEFIGMPGDRARVYYGHAQRVEANGEPRPGGATTAIGGADAELDRIGSNLILARQALLFNPTNTIDDDKLSADTAGFVYASNGFHGSAGPVATGFGATTRVYHALTDISAIDYGPYTTTGSNTILERLVNGGEPLNTTRYINTAFADTGERLCVNPSPNAGSTDFRTWAVAQGHPILAQSCSEIIIDFAADLNGDGEIDTDFNGQGGANAPIWWYDGLTQPNLTNGTTGWTNQASVLQPWVNIDANTQAFIFRLNDFVSFEDAGGTVGTPGTAHSYWPYLIRIRYRLHDTRGRLESNYRDAVRDGIDNDGDGDTDEADEERISGRWFERIISVPRP